MKYYLEKGPSFFFLILTRAPFELLEKGILSLFKLARWEEANHRALHKNFCQRHDRLKLNFAWILKVNEY